MMSSRITVSGQSSALRKSRLEGKPSLLPRPRRPGSIDRQSMEARRPSTTGLRSSSAEPRPTFGGPLSREASSTKLTNGGSRSQHSDRYGQSTVTPLRSSQYSIRPTTPRSSSEERRNVSWQTSLERALAFVTVKDQRPISNPAWQRGEYARVQAALAEWAGPGSTSLALLRPLTIARFVEITGTLLSAINRDSKLNTDNYVAKLQHLTKRLLYPGPVSKSWLKTVNTLHAFPNALALFSYLLDMVTHIETPVSDEWLYSDKSECAQLRRDYLHQYWLRFQDTQTDFEDLHQQYLHSLQSVLGDSDHIKAQMKQDIAELEGRLGELAAARSEEESRVSRREAAFAAVRRLRARRADVTAHRNQLEADAWDKAEKIRYTSLELDRSNAQNEQLSQELQSQSMSVEERARLLDKVDYARRVRDSRLTFIKEIQKMVVQKETDLALWQKRTLDACVQYKQGLIQLDARAPQLAALDVDQEELMDAKCCARMAHAVEELRKYAGLLSERRAEHARSKTALARKQAAILVELRARIDELVSSISHSQRALESEERRESADAAAWPDRIREITAALDEYKHKEAEYAKIDKELEFWEAQELAWRTELTEMRQYIDTFRTEMTQRLAAEQHKRIALVTECVAGFKQLCGL